VLPFFAPVLKSILRVLGTSPSFLFARYNAVLRNHIEGLDFDYTPTSERSGTMIARYHTTKTVPLCNFIASVPALETILVVCGTPGQVSKPEVTGPQSAKYKISW